FSHHLSSLGLLSFPTRRSSDLFSGCNLWSGREEDRSEAICRFCDTDFVGTDGPGGGKFQSAEELARAVAAQWQGNTTSNGTGKKSEEHTSELQSRGHLVCRLLL